MIYKSSFVSKDDIEYQVRIDTGVGSAEREITLSDTPFVVTMQSHGGDDIFKPCKYTSATVTVVTNGAQDFMTDIYTVYPRQVPVTLTANGETKWKGYVEPSVYDMGFNYDREIFEIDCMDGLAMLQYYKHSSSSKDIKSFKDIILDILRSHTSYASLHVPNGVFTASGSGVTLDKLWTSQSNFIDDANADDNWTEQKVIEQIMNYLNCTMTAYGDDVWVVKYPYTGNSWTTYDISTGSASSTTTSLPACTVGGTSYSLTGNNISVNKAYSKISVVAKVNSYEDVFPDIFDEKYQYNLQGDWGKTSTFYFKSLGESEYLPIFSPNQSAYKVKGTYKFLGNTLFNTWYYDLSTSTIGKTTDLSYTGASNYYGYQNFINHMGGYFVKAAFSENKAKDDKYENKSQANLEDYFLITNNDDRSTNYRAVLTPITNALPSCYVSSGMYFVLNCSMRVTDREHKYYIDEKYSEKNDDFSRSMLYLEAKLYCGGKWFNNVDSSGNFMRVGNWVDYETTFRMQFYADSTDHLNNKEFSLIETTGDYSVELTNSGYVIPAPPIGTIAQPRFELYHHPERIASSYRLDAIWVKQLTLKLEIPKDKNTKEDVWESDTTYTNVIDLDYIEEGDEKECLINTYDGKCPTYSSVYYGASSDSLTYLDEVSYALANDDSGAHRLEEWKVYDYVKQYSQPSIQLDLNLRNTFHPTQQFKVPIYSESTTFILESYEMDFYNATNKVTLIQLWNS